MSTELTVLMIFLALVIGFLISIPITLRRYKAGTLLIDTTDKDKDRYSFELEMPLDKLPKEKFITLRVKLINGIDITEPGSNIDINSLLMPPHEANSQ